MKLNEGYQIARLLTRGMLQHCRRWRTVLHNQIQGWSKSGGVS